MGFLKLSTTLISVALKKKIAPAAMPLGLLLLLVATQSFAADDVDVPLNFDQLFTADQAPTLSTAKRFPIGVHDDPDSMKGVEEKFEKLIGELPPKTRWYSYWELTDGTPHSPTTNWIGKTVAGYHYNLHSPSESNISGLFLSFYFGTIEQADEIQPSGWHHGGIRFLIRTPQGLMESFFSRGELLFGLSDRLFFLGPARSELVLAPELSPDFSGPRNSENVFDHLALEKDQVDSCTGALRQAPRNWLKKLKLKLMRR